MAEIKPRIASLLIYQGDVLDQIEHLEQTIEAAEAAEDGDAPRTLGDPLPSADLREKHAELVAEAEADAIRVRLRNLGRRTWNELIAKHPPRDENDDDAALGVNEESFFDEAIVLGLVEPEFTSDTERGRFLEDLAPSDWAQVKWKFWALNAVVAADPKPLPVSARTQPSDET
jgi:hypothetical protein